MLARLGLQRLLVASVPILGLALSVLVAFQAQAGSLLEGPVLASDDPAQVSGPGEVSYEENGEEAVATYTATGLEDDSMVWSLSGDDGGRFEITGGVLGFVTAPDYEKPSDSDTDNVYEVTITAADSSAASASLDATVTVTDVNDLNVIVIMADDAGYEVFGPYGTTQYSTPRLDAIASSGARFDNAFSKPLCTPSRSAIMTGKDNIRNYSNWITMVEDEYTFADLFSDAGYATAISGKWQLHSSTNLAGDASIKQTGQGFDTYCLWHTPLTGSETNSRYHNPWVECDGSLDPLYAFLYGPDIFAQFIMDFITDNQNRPFFVYYPMVLPHGPFVLPPDTTCDTDNVIQCIYEKMVTRLDRNVGLIYDKLSELELLDNTLLLFTSDNGTPRQMVSRIGNEVIYGGKSMPTDGGTRVPLIAHVPGETTGRVVSDLTDITDILPTVAEAAGLSLPADQTFDGVSFWPQLQGQAGQPREWIYTYYWPQPHKRSFYQPAFHPEIAYARDKRYKLYSTGELFDVSEDPLELYPLPADDADSADTRTTLQAVLDAMPSRGLGLIPDQEGYGVPLDGVPRPRLRPVLHSASITHDVLSLTYVGIVVTSPTPPVSSFTVEADGVEIAVTAVEMEYTGANESLVKLTLASEVVAAQTVTVSYVLGSDPIQHVDRGTSSSPTAYGAAPLSGRAVTNATPPNDPPTVTGPASVTFAEGGSGRVAAFSASDPQQDAVSWSLSGTDAALFRVGVNGVLFFRNAPDFESPADGDGDNVHMVTVEASDGRLTTTVAVSVTVTNEDETGQVRLSGTQPEVDSQMSAALTDPDGVLSETWSWWRSQNRADWVAMAGADTSSYTPSTADVDYWLRATVDYQDGHGAGKQSHAVPGHATRQRPPDNTPPRFSPAAVGRSVREDSGPGTAVGAPVTATDDDGDPLVYSLSGTDADSFVVAPLTGQITVGPDTVLDHGVRSTYSVTVIAADPSGETALASVTITVTAAPQAPTTTVPIVPQRPPPSSGGGGGPPPGGGGGGGGEPSAVAPGPVDQFSDLSEAGGHQGPVFALAAEGVLTGTGCGEGRLCPGAPISRWEMAVWLVRVIDGADPRPGNASRFGDVDGDAWWAAHVERLAELGITVGCSRQPVRYCPGDPVTRGQMASFLVRAFQLPGAPLSGFGDTTGNVHAANIDALLQARVTVGCSTEPFLYCPQQSTSRAQMASFLVRVINSRQDPS